MTTSTTFEEQQKDTDVISAKDLYNGKVSWDSLPEPYLILKDGGQGKYMAKIINVVAAKKGYRVISHIVTSDVYEHYVIM